MDDENRLASFERYTKAGVHILKAFYGVGGISPWPLEETVGHVHQKCIHAIMRARNRGAGSCSTAHTK